MALYCIGDLQGCDTPLGELLGKIDFSPSRDQLFVLGDLVNRGPESLQVLRRLMALDGAAHCLLGNHDIHLLAVAQDVRRAGRHDSLQAILQADDCARLLDWLRTRPLALDANDVLMVHAGVLPGWSRAQTLALAAEAQDALSGTGWRQALAELFGNEPRRWRDDLQGMERLRVIINALTRLRFCTADGEMEFDTKDGRDGAPPGFMPWFDVPCRATAADTIAFGHWSTLGWLDRQDVYALDSGCVWGGCLTALRLPEAGRAAERITVDCPEAQRPGGRA